MYGTIFAALYVGISVMSGTDLVLAVERSLPFLWYWHMTFAVVKTLVGALFPLFASFLVAAGNDDEKLAGIAMWIASPFVMFLMLILSVIYLVGVSCINSGLQDGEVINQGHVIIGCVLYGLAFLLQIKGTSSSKSSD